MFELARALEPRAGAGSKDCTRAFALAATSACVCDGIAADERIALAQRALALANSAELHGERSRLALLLADLCKRNDRPSEARDALTQTLARELDAATVRPFLQVALADVERMRFDPGAAFEALSQARALVPVQKARATLEERLTSVELQLELDLGLFDRAALRLRARVEELDRRLAQDASNTGIDANEKRRAVFQRVQLFLAQDQERAANDEVARALADEALFEPGSLDRAQLLVRRGLAQRSLSAADALAAADASFDEALACERLPPRLRASALAWSADTRIGRADAAEIERRLESARATLASIGDERVRRYAPEQNDVEVVAARLALANGAAQPERLRAHAVALRERFDVLLELWRSIPPRREGLGILQSASARALPSEWIRVELALDPTSAGAARAFDVLLAAQSAHALARARAAATPTLAQVREVACGKERGVLAFVPGPRRGHVFALDAETIVAAEIAGVDALHELRARCIGSNAGAPAHAALAAALLPPPIAARVARWKAFTVTGSDWLGEIAFEALPGGDSKCLGLTHAIGYTPSLPLSLALAREKATDAGELDAVVIACPTAAEATLARFPKLEPLVWRDAMLDDLRNAWKGARAVAHHGGGASYEALAAALGKRPRVLQLLCHGVALPAIERPAHLVLAPDAAHADGLVGCADVETLDAPPLVLLTTCRAGSGPSRRGDEGAQNLGGAWLTAGARCVVLSPGDLSLEPMVQLSRVVHARLAAGDAPDEALRRARVELDRGGFAAREWSSLHALGAAWLPLAAR